MSLSVIIPPALGNGQASRFATAAGKIESVRRFYSRKSAEVVPFLLSTLVALIAVRVGFAAQAAPGEPLSVTISTPQAVVTEPLPLRLTLHFHNAGQHTLWLYRPAGPAGERGGTSAGSTLSIHLEPVSPDAAGTAEAALTPALGTAFRVPGFPQPQLMPLAPGADAEENAVIRILPAKISRIGGGAPLWGKYKLILAYGAHYPNGSELRQALGVDIWSGSISTNALTFTLQPANPSNAGMISGNVINRKGLTLEGILVSLTGNSERLDAQSVTGPDGGFRFDHLPYGRYWVTVRDLEVDEDSSFFEHADVSSAAPDASMKLMMLNQQVYEAKRLLHKPVLFRIENGAGKPQAGAQLKILWSNGPIIENLKAETNDDGVAVVNLVPGSNYVTVTRRHCPKVDQVANVAPGGGIDGDSITFNCEK